MRAKVEMAGIDYRLNTLIALLVKLVNTARVAQWVEAMDLKSIKCRFESVLAYHRRYNESIRALPKTRR